jgi:hypothetical protein
MPGPNMEEQAWGYEHAGISQNRNPLHAPLTERIVKGTLDRRATAVARVLAFAGLMAFSVPALSQEKPPAEPEASELQKKLSNPISDLVSVPFQFNWSQNVGPNDQTQFLLNVQPVMPFALNKDWNLIARVILPLLSQPALYEGGEPAFGVSDILTSFFLSPSKGGLTWGCRAGHQPPFHNHTDVGNGKVERRSDGGGPETNGALTYGVLWNQAWSFGPLPAIRAGTT